MMETDTGVNGLRMGNFIAHDERSEHDNMFTSIYEDTYDGLLICRCNQNGRYPWQVRSILEGLSAKSRRAPLSALEAVRALIGPNVVLDASQIRFDEFPRKAVYNALTYLTRTGHLTRVGYGRYQAPPADGTPPHEGQV